MTDVKMLPKDFLAGMKELLGKETGTESEHA